MYLLLVLLFCLVHYSSASFFGGGGCGCAPQPQPICPPPIPVCAPPPPPLPCPPPAPVCLPRPAPLPVVSCCAQCNTPCRSRYYGRQRYARDTAEQQADPRCNSEELRQIIRDTMTSEPSVSKRLIQKAAQTKLSGKFDVICARGDFSYITNTNTYCQESNDMMTCYAYRHV